MIAAGEIGERVQNARRAYELILMSQSVILLSEPEAANLDARPAPLKKQLQAWELRVGLVPPPDVMSVWSDFTGQSPVERGYWD
jgi:hypothetical protein